MPIIWENEGDEEEKEKEKEILHVFDLPQLYTKPSAQTLVDALSLLAVEPPSWDEFESGRTSHDVTGTKAQNTAGTVKPRRRRQVNPEGLTRYLTSIIASRLRWIEDEVEREEIWEQASLRLSERSGRAAMPAMSRTFRIPTSTDTIDVIIHEPSLMADNLGWKTWASSYLLAKRLHLLRLFMMPGLRNQRILELGAGTGLAGIAAAAIFGASVCLTDLPEIESNLARNVMANKAVIERNGGLAVTSILDWTKPKIFQLPRLQGQPSPAATEGHATAEDTKFPVALAADPLYSQEHPRLLMQTIQTWLAQQPDARVVIEIPLREAYAPERQDFRTRMDEIGLRIIEEGEESGYDDWGGGEDGGLQEVRCWWSVWGWK